MRTLRLWLLATFVVLGASATGARWMLRREINNTTAAALVELRVMLAAQVEYASANSGLFGPPMCLGKPERCIPGYHGPAFLAPELAALSPRNRYARTFHPGPPPPPELLDAGKIDHASTISWAYVLTPATHTEGLFPVNADSLPGFCIDSRGMICYSPPASSMPRPVDGRCPVDNGCATMG